ncbi:MAG TPA: DUF3160 domain-containing protein [Polyangiaceae bacterium]|nr:DUF3160 domain-containing protein [Polyangiaceae bacterium]
MERRSPAAWKHLSAVLLALCFAACATDSRLPPPRTQQAAKADADKKITLPAPPAKPDENSSINRRFEAYRARHEGLSYAGLLKETGAKRAPEAKLDFDPTQIRYYDVVSRALKLNAKEEAIFKRKGFVSVDHVRRYSMASAYHAIYTRDLPVLITTDSILHALHRSYDQALMMLEIRLFTNTIDDVLSGTHAELGKAKQRGGPKALMTALADVDLSLTVARSLLAGAGLENTAPGVSSIMGQDKVVHDLLAAIRAKSLQRMPQTAIWGSNRTVDYSQFQPRGHYTENPSLKRYFQTLMWLGRADLGWHLRAPDKASGYEVDVPRERRAALVFATLLRRADQLDRLQAMSNIIDFMVGRADNVGVAALDSALSRAKVTELSSLGDDGVAKRVLGEIEKGELRAQQIRSQTLESNPLDTRQTQLPLVFQVFGQRFLLDSFLLSKVVYDSVVAEGKKELRALPSSLDVAAALGNDEAVFLLAPELDRYHYSANLLAARRVVEERSDDAWQASLYDIWLSTLRRLDDAPREPKHFPQAMRSRAWQQKQLQTQLGSWAELRHDTLLYGKQSYTATLSCEYPEGFVEPYPEVYASLAGFATTAARLLGAADVSHSDKGISEMMKWERDGQVGFFTAFARTLGMLENLANKELRAEPFTKDEELFLKKTVDVRGVGSGPPQYDGWYPTLIYGGRPALYKPTVADVHTVPPSDVWEAAVLEAGVGDVQFLIVAVDNEDDRAVYVGPAYSYYEFTVPPAERMTNDTWAQKIAGGETPARPGWTQSFVAPAKSRDLAPPRPH